MCINNKVGKNVEIILFFNKKNQTSKHQLKMSKEQHITHTICHNRRNTPNANATVEDRRLFRSSLHPIAK